MGPKRTRHAPYAYDPDLPGNWTTARLKQALNNRGIIYPSNAKRTQLIRLFEENSINRPGSPLDAQGAPSQDAPVQNNNGGDQRVMIDLVSKLSSTVQNLQQNVINLTSRVNSMNTQATSSSVSTENNHNIQSGSQSNFTLSTAMAAMSSSVSRPSVTTTGIADLQPAPSYKRTRFGFSAESLPLVETISPQLRQQITADGEIPDSTSWSRGESNSLYPPLYDVDRLDQQVTELLDASLSTSTKQTYSSALQCFLTFMCMNGVVCSRTSLASITETTLVYFVSHCKSALKLKYER